MPKNPPLLNLTNLADGGVAREFRSNDGKFEEIRLEAFFDSFNGNFDIQKEHINGNGEYVITAGLGENGIFGKMIFSFLTFIQEHIFP